MKNEEGWQLKGNGLMSNSQRKLLNAVCGDLSTQINWHGNWLSKDDWRHLLAGTMLGWRMMPAIDRGTGAAGFIMLGGSSLKLTREQATEAITCGLHLGDAPSEQGLQCKPVVWSDTVYLALWHNPRDFKGD